MLHNLPDLIHILNLKIQLAAGFAIRLKIKGNSKRFPKQLWQHGRKLLALGNDSNTIGAEAIAKQQNAEALRQSTAVLLRDAAADLSLRSTGKRYCHNNPSLLNNIGNYQIRTSGSNRMPDFSNTICATLSSS